MADPSRKDQKKAINSSSKTIPKRGDRALERRLAKLDERQAKRDEDMNQGFHNVFHSLQQLSNDILESKTASIAQEQSRERKEQSSTAPLSRIAPKVCFLTFFDLRPPYMSF